MKALRAVVGIVAVVAILWAAFHTVSKLKAGKALNAANRLFEDAQSAEDFAAAQTAYEAALKQGGPAQAKHLAKVGVACCKAHIAYFNARGKGTLAKHREDAVSHLPLPAVVRDARRQPLREPQPAVRLAQEQPAGVRGDRPPLKSATTFRPKQLLKTSGCKLHSVMRRSFLSCALVLRPYGTRRWTSVQLLSLACHGISRLDARCLHPSC